MGSCFPTLDQATSPSTMTSAFRNLQVLLLISSCTAYPGGSPSCYSRPGHGLSVGELEAAVTNIGGNNWQVNITETHKGLVLNSATKGSWDPVDEGYQIKGTCVTHDSRARKGNAAFVFHAKENEKPNFSGFIVFGYSSYAKLTF